MNIGIILAGGVGSRVGADVPKQFIDVFGKPVLVYTIEAFEKHEEIDAILVVCIKPYIDYLWNLKEKYNLKKLKWVTEGGDTFQRSVMNGIRFLDGKISGEDIVLVHFGASPFVTGAIISDCIRVCKEKKNAISTTDYYVLSGEKNSKKTVWDPSNYSDKYIDRDTIAVMNSPHAFRYGYIKNIYNKAEETGVINQVEPHTTTLMYAMGEKIYFALGSQNNIKITRKEDLELFRGYVLEQQRNTKYNTRGDVVVFLADGFEECEGLLVVDLLRRAGLKVVMASVMGRRDVTSSRQIVIRADCLAENADYESARLIVLPGGRKGAQELSNNSFVLTQCKEFAKEKQVAAVCAAPSILAKLGIAKRATVHPDYRNKMGDAEVVDAPVVVDEHIITGKGLGTTIPFALELIKVMVGKDKAEEIKNDICFEE